MKFEKLLDSAIQNTELKTENLDKILSWEIDFFSEDKTYEYKSLYSLGDLKLLIQLSECLIQRSSLQ